ncbi:MAG TPA: purine-binding chemotaxis protein CheW [Firmicutes bacterium]|nr:purine-binding chemotaxis protein CheW [Bacillota bacterium]
MAEYVSFQGYQEEEEDTLQGKYLTFLIGSDSYGIELRYVTEIIGIQPLTEVPEVPDYIRGIINLRGRIIPIMDVRLRFRKPFRHYNDRTCVIIVEMSGITMGLVVDSVAEVLSIPDEDIADPPEINKTYNRYIKGIASVGEEVKLILDVNKILTDDEVEQLSQL